MMFYKKSKILIVLLMMELFRNEISKDWIEYA